MAFARRTSPLTFAVVAVFGGAAAPAQAAQRSVPATCPGNGVDPDGEARHRAETLVHAPLRTVWNLHTDVESWPSWQRPATPMTIERLDPGPLRARSRFRFRFRFGATIQLPAPPTATVVITSTVRQIRRSGLGPSDTEESPVVPGARVSPLPWRLSSGGRIGIADGGTACFQAGDGHPER
ncbi:hypothetical protein F4559_004286 [Saccharothrix violaceirubra]|uniref:Coenzyme Q-binding protein COQ10 START domain-containing protein n=1 Tax=Saccharothrix violaceirubra TaxID=413306 RepID=A0A7W7T6H5_9PSEU|nr:hypothetical protein [Saccharothrix violaceirubra]